MQNQQNRELSERCLSFIQKSPSCYHVVENIGKLLEEAGYRRLQEAEDWKLLAGGRYYVTRNDSSILSFQLPREADGCCRGFHIAASHSDFPGFKLKENPEITVEDQYLKLNTEPYGGMIYSSWLDRSLSVAGRIIFEEDRRLHSRTVCLDEDLLVIPSLAIHINREVNRGVEYNPQSDLQPLFACGTEKGGLMRRVAQAAGVGEQSILGRDLFLYVREPGRVAGADGEFLLSPRLDDLQCVYATLEGMLAAKPAHYIAVHAVFDNEEVGSATKQGASSTFLRDTLNRIAEGMPGKRKTCRQLLADSFLLSADNAHAVHPNHPEKADPTNRPYLNGGIVIKYHSGQKYTTDAYSEAVVKCLCREAGVEYQTFYNRSDQTGGSTLGNLSSSQVSVPAADIGLAQLAMHSAVETAGSADTEALARMSSVFFAK